MPADCFVISGHNLCGYTHYESPERLHRTDSQDFKASMHLFFLRVEGLDNIAAVEQEDTKQTEQEIRQLLLNISM